jgi:hypothetical protein
VTIASINKLVSDHAAVQYLDRVRDVDVGHRDGMTDRGWLMRVCESIGTTGEDVKARILTPAAYSALAAGANRYVCSTHTLVMVTGGDGGRFVVTVLNARQHAKPQLPKKAKSR